MLFARIQATALVMLVLVPLAWSAPRLLGAPPAEQGAQTPPVPKLAPPAVPTPSRPMVDRYGDPLPDGAVTRLGTIRYRQVESIAHIIYAPDGRLVLTDNGESQIQIWDAQDGKKLREIDMGNDDAIDDFALSPDGKTIAVVCFNFGSNLDRIVHRFLLIDLATGRPARQAESDALDLVKKIVFTPDGHTAAIMDGDGKLLLWDVTTGQLRRQEIPSEGDVSAVTMSSGAAGPVVAIATDHSISITSVTQPHNIRTIPVGTAARPAQRPPSILQPHNFKLESGEAVSGNGLALSSDGTILAALIIGEDEIRLWRVSDGALLNRLKIREGFYPSHCAFSPDGKKLAAMGIDGVIETYDTATGKVLGTLSGTRHWGAPLAFSPDGKTLAATGNQQTLHFWYLATGKDRLATPEAHEGRVKALAFLPDGMTLISGSDDRTVRIWDLATGRPTKTLPHESEVSSLSISADGTHLATATEFDGSVHVWDLKTGKRLQTWEARKNGPNTSYIEGLAIDPDGSSVLVATGDGTLQCWETATGRERPVALPKLEKNANPVFTSEVMKAVFSRDGRTAALLSGFRLQVVDVASGEVRFKVPAKLACAFAPDGQSLAVGRLTPAKKGPLAGFRKNRIQLASFQNQIVFVAAEASIAWLDAQTGRAFSEITIPDDVVNSLAFSPDGKLIAVGARSKPKGRGILRIFRLRDRREIQTFEPPCHLIESLAFTPDGKQIAAGLDDTSIVLWDVRPAD